MASWRGVSKAVTPAVQLIESSAIASVRSRTRDLVHGSSMNQRSYHASTASFRIQMQKSNRITNHKLSPLPISQISPSAAPQLAENLTNVTKRWHGGPHVDHEHADSIHVSFLDADGNKLKADVDAYVGESLLQVAQRNDIELEGACEGVCACSTCHVIFPDEDLFDSLEEASEDEEDMLDMAYGLQETSRLGCQIIISKDMDGMEVEIPPATRNFYVDGHVPKPH